MRDVVLVLDWESIIACSIIVIGIYLGLKIEKKVFGNKGA